MSRIWLGNITPETTDDELKQLVKRYAPDIECVDIQRVEGAGRPAALMTFTKTQIDSLPKLSMRLSGMHWKGRTLTCSTTVT